MTNAEATTTIETAAVAEQGAHVAPKQAASKKGASRKKGAPKGQKAASKPVAKVESLKNAAGERTHRIAK